MEHRIIKTGLSLVFLLISMSFLGWTMDSPPENKKVSFKNEVLPIMEANCGVIDCHDGMQPPYLLEYREIANFSVRIKQRVESQKFPMPPSYAQKKLSDEEKEVIIAWIDQGCLNN